MRNIFFLTILSLLLFACKQNTPSKDIKNLSNIPKIDTISYDLKSISKEFGDCDDTPVNCATAKIRYASIKSTTPTPAYQTINTTLISSIKGDASDIPTSLDSFINEAKAFFEEFPETAAGYAMELEQSVLFNNAQILTIEEFLYSYTGGAHGNYGTSFYNFDVASGEKMELKNLLVDNYQAALNAIAEPIFKETYLEEGMTKYSEAGFYFENDVFILTDNFAITKEGLKFVYNPYEVAPYAMGQQEIIIPYTEIKDLIRKSGVLANL